MTFVFVFGSNLAGIHGAGAAKYAVHNFGAEYGVGVGMTGSSYALPTKDENLNTLSLHEVNKYVDQFLEYATDHPEINFQLTAIGCGLAGYEAQDIVPLFYGQTPENVTWPPEFFNPEDQDFLKRLWKAYRKNLEPVKLTAPSVPKINKWTSFGYLTHSDDYMSITTRPAARAALETFYGK